MTDPLPRSPFCATLVVDEAITKPDALGAVARTLGTSIRRPGTSRPFVEAEDDAWAEVEIPKFGEAPPLSIDVYSTRSTEHAQTAALALMQRLIVSTGWAIQPMFTP